MKKHILTSLLLGAMVSGNAIANNLTWLESGSTVHASPVSDPSAASARNKPDAAATPVLVKLATGQTVRLSGGVYVKAKDPSLVVAWAQSMGLVATEDNAIEGAVLVETTPEQSIGIAAQLAQVEGVSTAAPRYKTRKVLK